MTGKNRLRWLWMFGASFVSAVGPGCAQREMPVYPVGGQVFAGAKKLPATGAMVIFNPVQQTSNQLPRPRGIVDAEGRYLVTTRIPNDGAPAGEYIVTLMWPTNKKTVFDPEEEDKLRGAYLDVQKSKIRFVVQAIEMNEAPVIQLP